MYCAIVYYNHDKCALIHYNELDRNWEFVLDKVFEPTCSMDKFEEDLIKFLNDFNKHTDNPNFDFNEFIYKDNDNFYLVMLG